MFSFASVTFAILFISHSYAYVPPSLPRPISTSAPASLRISPGRHRGAVASSLHNVGGGSTPTCRGWFRHPMWCASGNNAAAANSLSLYLSPNDDNNDANDASTDDKSTATKNPIGQTLEFLVFTFSSYVIQFLGVAFSLGLLLNICGYGYTFDLERGVHIDKMENIRTELQFRREVQRSN